MSVKVRCGFIALFFFSASLAACQAAPTPAPTKTPTLNVSLWVDYPVVSIALFMSKKYTQYANVIVTDVSGKPVAGVTLIGQCMFSNGMNPVTFPVTDAKGQARALLEVTTRTTLSMHTINVTAIRNTDWSLTVTTSFDVIP
jgi:hypothetical protein